MILPAVWAMSLKILGSVQHLVGEGRSSPSRYDNVELPDLAGQLRRTPITILQVARHIAKGVELRVGFGCEYFVIEARLGKNKQLGCRRHLRDPLLCTATKCGYAGHSTGFSDGCPYLPPDLLHGIEL